MGLLDIKQIAIILAAISGAFMASAQNRGADCSGCYVPPTPPAAPQQSVRPASPTQSNKSQGSSYSRPAAAAGMLKGLSEMMRESDGEDDSADRARQAAAQRRQAETSRIADEKRREAERALQAAKELEAQKLAKDSAYRNSLTDPFAADGGKAPAKAADPFEASTREAMNHAQRAGALKVQALAALQACRLKHRTEINRPGLGVDRFCVHEVEQVRKFESYEEGWSATARQRVANEPASIQHREALRQREINERARLERERREQKEQAAYEAEAADRRNSLGQQATRYVEEQMVKGAAALEHLNRVKSCVKGSNPFSDECKGD